MSQKQFVFEKWLHNLELERHRGYVGGIAANFRKFVVTVQYPSFDTAYLQYLA